MLRHSTTRVSKPVLFTAAILLAGASAISAAGDLPASVLACRAEKDDARRLSCFDREVARITQQSGDAQAIPAAGLPSAPAAASTRSPAVSSSSATATPAEPAAAAESTFGFPGGSAPAERQKDQASGLKQMQATVTQVSKRGYGQLLITLDNGQVWEQLAADEDFELNAQDKVTIKRASFGSYLMTNSDRRSTRVRRLR